jgi:transposase
MSAALDLTPAEVVTLCAQDPLAGTVLVTALFAQLHDLQALNTALLARVQALEDQQSRSSLNSHQPPASDGLRKQPRSLRQRSGKAPGGQPGHPGHTLRFTDAPDAIAVHRPTHCGACGTCLDGLPALLAARRQVVDLPPLHLQTVEHQVVTVGCPLCQQVTSGAFPPEAPEPVQYGPRLKALAVYLRYYQLLPSARTAELLDDLFGSAPSEGTLTSALHEVATELEPVVERIRASLQAAPVVHFDETGCYVEDKRYWLHVACTAQATYYSVQRPRGQAGSTAAGVLPAFRGTAVHDAYAAYWPYPCTHALCNAHLLRDLLFLVERYAQEWAGHLAELLRAMLDAVNAAHEAGAEALPQEQVTDFETRYAALVAAGFAANPPAPPPPEPHRGRVKQSPAYNLLVRLRDHAADELRFLHDFAVPFDNNQAERDVRMMKVQQKISGRFRTAEGAKEFCRIRSYIGTLRKQEQPVLRALEQAFRGTPPLPTTLS